MIAVTGTFPCVSTERIVLLTTTNPPGLLTKSLRTVSLSTALCLQLYPTVHSWWRGETDARETLILSFESSILLFVFYKSLLSSLA